MSTGAEHAQRAAELLADAEHEYAFITTGECDPTIMTMLVGLSRAHAALAQVQFLREIGDQLDSFPRRFTLNGKDIAEALIDLDEAATRPVVRG